MEHRYAARKSVELDVVVSLPRLGLVRGCTSDISLGGMFIKTECVAMPVNALVTVNFQPEEQSSMVCFQARAMVVHQRAGGFGLMFDRLESGCAQALRRLLASEPVTDAPGDSPASNDAVDEPMPIPRRAWG